MSTTEPSLLTRTLNLLRGYLTRERAAGALQMAANVPDVPWRR